MQDLKKKTTIGCTRIRAKKRSSPVSQNVRRQIMTKSFNEVKNDFSPDGALRDFYIKDITQSDWNRFLNFVIENIGRFVFQWDCREIPIPNNFHEIKNAGGEPHDLNNMDW
jgi:hypothetical protein